MVIQGQQTGRGKDVRVALGLQCIENHRHGQVAVHHAPAQGCTRRLGQRTGDISDPYFLVAVVVTQNSIGDSLVALSLGGTGADVAAKRPTVVGEQPLQSQFSIVRHRQLYDDGLHQYLCSPDIKPGNDRLQSRHLISICRNDQRICALIGFNGGIRGRTALPVPRLVEAGNILHYPGQHLRHLYGVGIFQINHLDVATLLQWRIQVVDQVLDPLRIQLVCCDDDAIGAFVGDQGDFLVAITAITLGLFFQGLQHLDNVLSHCIPQLDDLGALHSGPVHTVDDVDNSINVGSNIRDDDGIARGVGRHVSLLGHQGTKHGNQLGGRDILQADNLGHILIVIPLYTRWRHINR